MAADINHFEIHASDPDASMAFYKATLGWEFIPFENPDPKAPGYWLIMTRPEKGVTGGLMQRMGPAPEKGAPVMGGTLIAYVDDIDAAMERATKAGGSLAIDKMVIPNVGAVAYFHDPDNNIFGIMQPEEAAS